MSESRTASASSAPGRVLFREKLTPSPAVWAGIALFGLAVFAVGAPISIPVGIVVGVVLAATVGLILYAASPVLEVTEEHLQVGRAHIERIYVGEVEVFRGEAARVACGPALDGRAFMNFRPWVPPVARIEITDPADPTPYWITHSRRPEEFALALGADPEHQRSRQPEVTEIHAEQDESTE